MPAAIPIPEERLAELENLCGGKLEGNGFRRFLCVWLRVKKSMTAYEIAEVVNFHPDTVRIAQRNFISQGSSSFIDKPHGGRMRELMTAKEEKALLSGFTEAAEDGSILIAKEIKVAIENKVGRQVEESTVYRILKRNGWRKVMPRPERPKHREEAAEAFKKGVSRRS
ncbi:MAG: winged helix-turn-helix domain-containing protein [Holophagales bacterium]|jgi:transposase|nr:winged helix-turn-helix domain-containing protein [Holophagales bacterium]